MASSVQQALDRFKLVSEAEADQRKAQLEASEFANGKQWRDTEVTMRKAGTLGNMAIPARPCLVLDQLGQPINQILNQAKNARLSVHVSPKSDATEEDAEIRQGLYRNIEVESRANLARNWALKQAIIAGRGFYRILKAYANDGDEEMDLVIKRILNQFSVYLDPFHQEPDGSDAEWAFIVEDVPWTRFTREHPDSDLASFSEQDFSSLGDNAPGWMNGEGEARTVRVAEYFCAHYEAQAGKTRHGQPVQQRSIAWQKINGIEVLEEEAWEGRYIPIVQVVGDEVNINGVRTYKGIVEPAMDAQRSYNYMRSAEVETIALAPKAPFLIMEGLIEGYEHFWNAANTKNLPYLTYRNKNLGGSFAPPPKRNIEEPAIQAVTMASRQAKEDVQSITSSFDPSRGRPSSPDQSGRAIQALQQQSEQGTSGFLDSLATISMTHEARIILDLMPYVYDTPGRIVKVLEGDDDAARSVMLNAPHVRDPQTQQPMPAPPGADPAQVKHYELSKGSFSVVVDIGKSYTSRMAEANEMMGNLSKSVPQMVPLYADIWVNNMDIPGGKEIAERFKKMLPPQLQQGENGQLPPGDPQAQAQIQQLQMQLQQASQLADANQAKLQIAQMQIESSEKIKAAEIASKQAIEQAKAEAQAQIAQMKASVEAGIASQKMALEQHKVAFQANEAERQRAHEAQTHQVDLQHAEQSAQTQHIHTLEQQASQPAPAGV